MLGNIGIKRDGDFGVAGHRQGRRVVALTADTAAVENASGNIVSYRKLRKPALGPVGDSLDDFVR